MRRIAVGCLAFVLLTGPARAEWLEVQSDHFVIFGNQDEKTLRAFAERLESYHSGLQVMLRREQPKPSPSNRVTVYVVNREADVRRAVGTDDRYLAGAYIPSAGGSIAVVPKIKGARSEYDLSGEMILLHEYAHHFLWGITARAFPRWFSEGFAEYLAGVKFRQDGSLAFGTPATHRGLELEYARRVPMRTLLEFDGGAGDPRKGPDSFYGQSWILFYYLFTSPERRGQLGKYQQLLGTGDTALEAAEGAFGDLDQLEKDMLAYAERSKVNAMVVAAEKVQVGPIAVRPLRGGEAAMIPIVVQSKAGVSKDEAAVLLPQMRAVAARYPDDPAVLAALAEAEYDAGYDDEAIAAADRALAIDSKQINAYLQKGYAFERKLRDGKIPRDGWKDVHKLWVQANRIENEHPVPLVHFYLAYVDRGERPDRTAVQGLEWAMQLAPFDSNVRWLVAHQMIEDERYSDAADVLAPLAYSPHPGEFTDRARSLLAEVEVKAGRATSSASATAAAD